MTPLSSVQPSGLRISVTKRAVSAATVAIIGLSTVRVVAPDWGALPAASAEPQTVNGQHYNDQAPQNVPWGAVKNENQFSGMFLSLDAISKEKAKTGKYGNWGSSVPLTIWSKQDKTDYKNVFSGLDRPVPFKGSNRLATPLGEWSYTSEFNEVFSVNWTPAPGYIGYAPPLPIQIDPFKSKLKKEYHYATVDLPGKGTTDLTSTGAFGATQTAQASAGFNGVKDGMGWSGFTPKYAFQVDRQDAVAGKVDGALDYKTDAATNYLGHVTTELNTSEGKYSINPDTGEVSFTPSPTFFSDAEVKDANITQKSAAPVRVVVSNMTTNTIGKNRRVMAYGQTRPAHTINPNNASYAEVTTLYTPNVVKPTVGLNNAEANELAGRDVTLNPDFAQSSGQAAIDKSSVALINATGQDAGRELTVDGEGTWKVNRNGSVTFTPELGFVGNPTPIQYTAKNEHGVPAGRATLSVRYDVQDGTLATTIEEQGKAQKSTDNGKGDWGLTAQKMFPGYPRSWYGEFTYGLVTPDGELVTQDTSLQIANVGRYSINKNTGEVTFTPEPSFTGAAPAVGVRITNLKTANGQPRPADGHYRPIVSTTNMILRPVSATGEVGEKLTAAPKYGRGMVPGSVQIDGADADSSGKTKTIPNQGAWSVDREGVFTFTPVDGFYGTPDPVDYTVANAEGVRSEPGTVLGEYKAVKTSPSTSTGDANQPQKSKSGREMFPSFPSDWTIAYSLADAADNVLTRNEGTYTIVPTTGVVTFEPADNYRGTPGTVTVEAMTKTGAKESTTYQVSVTGQTTATNTTTLPPVTETVTTEVPTTVTTAVPTTVGGVPTTVEKTVTTTVTSKSTYQVTVTTTPPQATITQFPAPMTETISPSPVTVTPAPITTTVNVTGEPTAVTATPEAITATVPDVVTTVSGTPVTVAVPPVTVTPNPVTVTVTPRVSPTVTVTPEPATATPDPVTTTLTPAPITTTLDGNSLEISDSVIKVTAPTDNPFSVQVDVPEMETGSLKFTGVGGVDLQPEITPDMREMKVPGQGRWIIDSATGEITFFPNPNFGGRISRAELAYKRKDGSEHKFTIQASYPKTEEPEEPSNTGTPNKPTEPKPSGNSRDALLWLLPFGLLAAGLGLLGMPTITLYPEQIKKSLTRQ